MQKYNACAQSIAHSLNVQHLSVNTLYIHDLQYTRNTVVTKDWKCDEIKKFQCEALQKIFHCNDTVDCKKGNVV